MLPPLSIAVPPLTPALLAPAVATAGPWTLLAAALAGGAAVPLLRAAVRALRPRLDPPKIPTLGKWQAPCFAALAPLLAVLAVARFGASALAAAAVALLWTLLVLAWIDAETQQLPDALTLPLIAAGLVVNAAGGLATWPQALAGALAGWLLLALPQLLYRALTRRSGVGQGDYKLLAALGAWLGAPALVGVVLYAAAAAALIGAVQLARRRATAQQRLAFGPMLAAAAALVMLR